MPAPTNCDAEPVRQIINTLRNSGWTTRAISQASGVSVTMLSAISNGHQARVRRSTLEPVTPAENQRRRALAQTHCVQGHPFDEVNTYLRNRDGLLRRECRACVREAQRRYQQRKRQSQGRAA